MHISSRFVIVYSIELVIRMLYHSSETLSLLSFFYLMVKLGKPLFKIGFHFQIALFFLFYRNFYPRPPTLTAYLFGPNVPSPPLIWNPPPPSLPVYSEPKSMPKIAKYFARLLCMWSTVSPDSYNLLLRNYRFLYVNKESSVFRKQLHRGIPWKLMFVN